MNLWRRGELRIWISKVENGGRIVEYGRIGVGIRIGKVAAIVNRKIDPQRDREITQAADNACRKRNVERRGLAQEL